MVAGFAGVSLLVAGTASAMVAGQIDGPIAFAVQLQQEDPTSQTAPVPAQVTAAEPIEVGSGAIKCDADGNCASRIKVEANATATSPSAADREPVETGPTASNTSGSEPHSPNPGAPASDTDSAERTQADGKPNSDAQADTDDPWNFDKQNPKTWDSGWDDRWREGWEDRLRKGFVPDWDRSPWNASDWRDDWRPRN